MMLDKESSGTLVNMDNIPEMPETGHFHYLFSRPIPATQKYTIK